MTPTNFVKQMFLSLIDDPDLAQLKDDDFEELLDMWLKLAIMEFHNCKKDLSLILMNGETFFNDVLDNDEIGILSYAMLIAWVQPKIRCWDNIRQHVGTRDFSKLSNANMLLRLNDLHSQTEEKLKKLKARYHSKFMVGLG